MLIRVDKVKAFLPLSVGVNLLSREGNSQDKRMRVKRPENKSFKEALFISRTRAVTSD